MKTLIPIICITIILSGCTKEQAIIVQDEVDSDGAPAKEESVKKELEEVRLAEEKVERYFEENPTKEKRGPNIVTDGDKSTYTSQVHHVGTFFMIETRFQ